MSQNITLDFIWCQTRYRVVIPRNWLTRELNGRLIKTRCNGEKIINSNGEYYIMDIAGGIVNQLASAMDPKCISITGDFPDFSISSIIPNDRDGKYVEIPGQYWTNVREDTHAVPELVFKYYPVPMEKFS